MTLTHDSVNICNKLTRILFESVALPVIICVYALSIQGGGGEVKYFKIRLHENEKILMNFSDKNVILLIVSSQSNAE